jgi:histidine triad (HIT) family protein
MASGDCIFCKILAGELPSHAVGESERAYAFADISPATRGHSLVIPRTHAADIHDISSDDLTACALLAKEVAGRAREHLGAAGVNILHSAGSAAWQVVFHFHIHVIPRYPGDPLRLPWTPAPGDPDDIAAAALELRG